jgi:serine/threonine protein kinase
MEVNTTFDLSPGTVVDRRYQIQHVLGRGGFGRTYLAIDQCRFNDLCVLKEFAPTSQTDATVNAKLRELFQREATTLHQLAHPQIPEFFSVFESDGRLFIAQEYINGQTYWSLLRDRQQSGESFSELEIVQWLWDLLQLLDYLHGQNIIHRDISPDNIMLAKGRACPVLIDFGAVKQAAIWMQSAQSQEMQASVSVGKSGYAPYEQLRLGQCSPRSDLYALAVTAVVLLTVRSPNQLIDPHSLAWQWQPWVDLKPGLVQILETMMAEKPQERYGTAQEVLAELRSLYPELSTQRLVPPHVWQDQSPHDWLSLPSMPPLVAVRTVVESSLVSIGSNESRSIAGGAAEVVTAVPPNSDLSSASSSGSVSSFQAESEQSVQKDQQPVSAIARLQSRLSAARGFRNGFVLGLLTILPMGGLILGVASPRIAALCPLLQNCVEQDSNNAFHQWIAQANQAQQASEQPHDLTGLQQERDRLAQAIQELDKLAGNDRAARQIINNYRQSLQKIETRLQVALTAQTLLQQAHSEALEAERLIKVAQTPQDYERAQLFWMKALTTLSNAPKDDPLFAQVIKNQLYDYALRIDAINLKLGRATQVIPNLKPDVSPDQILAQPIAAIAPPLLVPVSSTASASPLPFRWSLPMVSSMVPSRGMGAIAQGVRSTTANPSGGLVTSDWYEKTLRLARSSVAPNSSASLQATVPAPVPAPVQTIPAAPTLMASTQEAMPSRRTETSQSSKAAIRTNPSASPRPAPTTPTVTPTVATTASSASANVREVNVREVSIALENGSINARGTYTARLVVNNRSDRSFGFMPTAVKVSDAQGREFTAVFRLTNAETAVLQPGESLSGNFYVFNLPRQPSSQQLALQIKEGTSGQRDFQILF